MLNDNWTPLLRIQLIFISQPTLKHFAVSSGRVGEVGLNQAELTDKQRELRIYGQG